MTIWVYVKTKDDPKAVGDVVCSFNFTQGKHPEPGYWVIKGKYAALKDLSEIGDVYRIGDTVVFSEIDDDLAPDFLDPLLAKYGFDNVKWIVVSKTR
jgi:hypothetical protein